MSDYTDYVNDYMNNYNCPDCNEAKLQSDKVARKVNEVIEQVNQIIEIIEELRTEIDDIKQSIEIIQPHMNN